MSTNFPTSLQDLDATRGTTGQKLNSPNHITHHTTEDDTIEALQAKVGADSSVVNTSHDFKLSGVATADKAVSLTGTETLTNKTLTSPDIDLGSDAEGDVYYRDGSGEYTRLAIGSAAQIMQVNAGATAPEWVANPAASDASVTVKGVLEVATTAEVNSGAAAGSGDTTADLAVTTSAIAASDYKKESEIQTLIDTSVQGSYKVGVIADYAQIVNGTDTDDVTVSGLGFTPRIIKIHYYLSGHTPASGSNTYEQKRGVAVFTGTTLTFDNEMADSANDSDNAKADGGSNSPNGTTTLSAGDNSGTGYAKTTLTINSVAAGQFVVRRFGEGDNSVNCRAKVAYEVYE